MVGSGVSVGAGLGANVPVDKISGVSSGAGSARLQDERSNEITMKARMNRFMMKSLTKFYQLTILVFELRK
jgi:hypothetical protein